MRLASTPLGLVLLSGCQGLRLQPLMGVNTRLSTPGDDRSPSMARQGVVWIAPGPAGQHQVRWFDLASGMGGPLPGLNRPDAQPISVSVDAKGSRIALVRSLDGRTELLLYNRNLASVRPLMLVPAGVPARVALSADGQQLAVQVSRCGRWEVEVMRVP